MKICFLAGASTIHTVRWVNAIANLGHEVSLISMHPADMDKLDARIKVHELKFTNKLGYYLNVSEVKKLLSKIQPDLLNVHYASGYGTLSRLANFAPSLLSVWGSDVYLYPYQSKRNEKTLRKNLIAANQIASTSRAMKKQTELFIKTSTPIEVTPFGIDLELFSPSPEKQDDNIVIGTVKRLEVVYGIDVLILATAKLIGRLRDDERNELVEKIQLKIVGNGSELVNLERLAKELNIINITEFVGAIPNDEVPKYLNEFDIYCAFSHSESFGVAVLEASACEVPVVVSHVGGLPEVVQNGETGFVVNHKNIDEVVEQLLKLVINQELRQKMGRNGRLFVKKHFEWHENVLRMEKVYRGLIERHNI